MQDVFDEKNIIGAFEKRFQALHIIVRISQSKTSNPTFFNVKSLHRTASIIGNNSLDTPQTAFGIDHEYSRRLLTTIIF